MKKKRLKIFKNTEYPCHICSFVVIFRNIRGEKTIYKFMEKFSETRFLDQGTGACMISIKGLAKAVDFTCFERIVYSFIFRFIFSSTPGFPSGLGQLLAV